MMRPFILACLLCLINFTGFAQNEIEFKRDTILVYVPVRETFLITAVNLNQFAQIENMVSPLIYKGIGAGATLGFYKRKKKTFTSFMAQYSKSKLYNEMQPLQYFVALTHLNVNMTACYQLSNFEQKKTKLSLGWQIAYRNDFRRNDQLQNSSITYNLSTSLSPMLRVEKWLTISANEKRKFLKKGRSMRLSYQLATPLLAGVSRPPFNAIRAIHDGLGNTYQNSITQEIVTNYGLYSLNHFFAIYNSLNFEYFLRNGTRLSLQYSWNFENFNIINKSYKVGQSGFQLAIHTRINAL